MNSRLILRMTALFVATSLLLPAVGVGTAWYVHGMQQGLNDSLLDNASSMRAAEELEILLREMRTQFDHFLLTGDRKYLEETLASRQDTNRWLTEAERWSFNPREKELATPARSGHDLFYKELQGMLDQAPNASLPQKVRVLIDDVLTPEILQPTHAYLDFNEVEVLQSVRDNQVFADRMVWGLVLLGTCASGAGLIAGVGFARGFKRSLIQLSVPIRAAAGQRDAVVGPVTFPFGADLKAMEGVLQVVAKRIGAVIERLRQSEREVLRAEQLAALGQMAAGMAHELRNPLTSMKILVQAAPAGEGYGLGGRDLAVFEEEISRLEKLIQSFLDFARPSQLAKKGVDVRKLVEQSIGLLSGRAARTGVRIAFSPPPGAIWAEVDPDPFRQVVLNLLLNALDAVQAGGAVHVGVENDASGGLSVRVADDGCGLPPDLGARIFSPFVTTKETGLGLGLSISKRIVEAHGGVIAAENRPEGGAVFTIRLPPSEWSVSRDPEGSAPAPRPPPGRG